MKKTLISVFVVLFLAFSTLASNPAKSSNRTQGATEIALEVVGSKFKLVKYYKKAAKEAYEFSYSMIVEQAAYGGMLKEFEQGVLDLNSDKLTGLPRWSSVPFQGKKLIQSEITFQCRMVQFLESKGIDKNNRLLKSTKERLFAEQASLDAGNADEAMFNNMKALRQVLIRLREKVK